MQIDDITKFVRTQKHILDKKGEQELLVDKETVYCVDNPDIAHRIQLDFYSPEPNGQTTVVKGYDSPKRTLQNPCQSSHASGLDEEDSHQT